MDLDAILKPFSTKRTGEIGGVIDEKHGVGDVVFFAQLGEEFPSDRNGIRWKEPSVQDSVGFWIDCGVQPVLFVVDPDRLLIDRDSIRTFAASWL